MESNSDDRWLFSWQDNRTTNQSQNTWTHLTVVYRRRLDDLKPFNVTEALLTIHKTSHRICHAAKVLTIDTCQKIIQVISVFFLLPEIPHRFQSEIQKIRNYNLMKQILGNPHLEFLDWTDCVQSTIFKKKKSLQWIKKANCFTTMTVMIWDSIFTFVSIHLFTLSKGHRRQWTGRHCIAGPVLTDICLIMLLIYVISFTLWKHTYSTYILALTILASPEHTHSHAGVNTHHVIVGVILCVLSSIFLLLQLLFLLFFFFFRFTVLSLLLVVFQLRTRFVPFLPRLLALTLLSFNQICHTQKKTCHHTFEGMLWFMCEKTCFFLVLDRSYSVSPSDKHKFSDHSVQKWWQSISVRNHHSWHGGSLAADGRNTVCLGFPLGPCVCWYPLFFFACYCILYMDRCQSDDLHWQHTHPAEYDRLMWF